MTGLITSSLIGGLGSALGGSQPASNAQSAVQQYDPTKAFAGFNQNQAQSDFYTALGLELQQANEPQAASPGDVAAGPKPPGGNVMAGGGGMSDSGFG